MKVPWRAGWPWWGRWCPRSPGPWSSASAAQASESKISSSNLRFFGFFNQRTIILFFSDDVLPISRFRLIIFKNYVKSRLTGRKDHIYFFSFCLFVITWRWPGVGFIHFSPAGSLDLLNKTNVLTVISLAKKTLMIDFIINTRPLINTSTLKVCRSWMSVFQHLLCVEGICKFYKLESLSLPPWRDEGMLT